MGLFTKADKVPEIPAAPSLPELPSIEKKDLPELPSFPATSKNENLNQEIVKSAVADVPSSGENEVIVDAPKSVHVEDAPEEESIIPPRPSESSIPELPVPEPEVLNVPKKTLELSPSNEGKPVSKQIEPIFVRIDKFQSAQKDFEQIKEKVKEIELVLKKIKDVKSQEETELKGWTEDIEKIKSRLSGIDAGIFGQI